MATPQATKKIHEREEDFTLHDALALARLGWSIIPLCHPKHLGGMNGHSGASCKRPGKQPAVKWKLRQVIPMTEDELTGMFHNNPHLNLGVVCGKVSGIVMVDIDTEKGEDAWNMIAGANLPPTWEFGTGRGGRHLVYAWPHEHAPAGNPFKQLQGHLDFLGEGRQSVIPPSLHRLGSRYEWKVGGPGSGMPLAPAPTVLCCHPERSEEADREPVGGASVPPLTPIHCASVQTLQRAAAWVQAFRPAVSGQMGNTVLYTLACSLVHGFELHDAEAIDLMAGWWNQRCQPPWEIRDIERAVVNARAKGKYDKIEEKPMARKIPAPVNPPVKEEECPWVSGEDVVEGEYKFFWPPYIPKGIPCFLAGHGGVGKSTFQAFLATTAKRTLILAGEEDAGCAILPRLKALGIPPSRWAHMPPSRDWMFPDNIERFGRMLEKGGFDLVIADPIDDYVRIVGQGDPHDQIRQFLNELRMMTMQVGVAMVLCRHPGKSAGNICPGNRAWRNVPRVIIEMLKDDGPPVKYIIRCEKYQIGREPLARYYDLDFSKGPLPRFVLGELVETGEAEIAGDQIDRIDRVKIDEACDFLKHLLASDSMDSTQVYKLGEGERLDPTTIRRASIRLGVIKDRTGTRCNTKSVWSLPPSAVLSEPAKEGGAGDVVQT